MKRLFITVVLVLTFAVTTGISWGGPWGGRFYGVGPAVSGLTRDMQAKILAIQLEHQERIQPIQEQLWKKSTELRDLRLRENPEQTAIEALQCEVYDLIYLLQEESNSLKLDILKVIGP
jgi:hypothetical protein